MPLNNRVKLPSAFKWATDLCQLGASCTRRSQLIWIVRRRVFHSGFFGTSRWERGEPNMPAKTRKATATVCLACCTLILVIPACRRGQVTIPASPRLVVVYANDFDGPAGSTFPEWTTSPVTFVKTVTGETGSLPAGAVTTVESPNRRQRFLGEFGGPPIGRPGDPDWNRTRVDQSVRLSLKGLRPHTRVKVSFDLYVLKSWDGNSPRYGPDRFTVRVAGGSVLLATTFSNNPKVREDGSYQSYPGANGVAADHAPQTGAASTGTLGYSDFFSDGVYQLSFAFPHTESALTLEFSSSLFEGKGTADESWGLDNVVVSADVTTVSQPASERRKRSGHRIS